MTVVKRNSTVVFTPKFIVFIMKKSSRVTMATFTRLLQQRIVASSRSLSSSSSSRVSSFGCLRSWMSFMSDGVSEKKAISLPLTIAEQTSRTRATTNATIAPVVSAFTVIPAKKVLRAE